MAPGSGREAAAGRQAQFSADMACVLLVLLGVALTAGAHAAHAAKLPPDFKRCAVKDPNMDECLRNAIEDALVKLKNGNPKLGLPFSLDPLAIDKLELSQGNPQGPITMTLVETNVQLKSSLDGVKVLSAKFDPQSLKLEVSTLTPVVTIESDYTVNGRILLLPITGNGPSKTIFENLTTEFVIQGKNFTKPDGKEYMKVVNVVAALKPKKMALNLENLFNGDKQLGETMNRVVNENWELIFNEIKKPLNEAYAQIFIRIVGQVFSKVPLREVFIYDN